MHIFVVIQLIWRCLVSEPTAPALYRCSDGKVNFLSNAPLEVIEAESSSLNGIIDAENQTFAWFIDVRTFQGFNGPLQREHFNENYLESNIYPKATFTGKIIETVNFQQNGVYTIRAKGKLTIHGVARERIIKSRLTVKGKTLLVESDFTIPLADHNIAIPKIVHQKISETIAVTIRAELMEKP